MGSTILKLANQGHNVHIAYMTSGNYSVFDHDAKKYLDFFENLAEEVGISGYSEIKKLVDEGFKSMETKKIG